MKEVADFLFHVELEEMFEWLEGEDGEETLEDLEFSLIIK